MQELVHEYFTIIIMKVLKIIIVGIIIIIIITKYAVKRKQYITFN
jgi:hypothetical protein